MGKKLHPLIAVSIGGCIAGMYLLCMSGGFAGIYMGDVCEFLCAVGFMCHILTVEHFAKEDGIKLSCIQFAVCAILSGVMMLFTENVDFAGICAAGLPILYTGVLSSGIAYTLQIIGQKYAQASVASIVMSLESVFSVLAAMITILMGNVFPVLMDWICRINAQWAKIICIVLWVVMVVDFFVSFGHMIKAKNFYLKWKIFLKAKK